MPLPKCVALTPICTSTPDVLAPPPPNPPPPYVGTEDPATCGEGEYRFRSDVQKFYAETRTPFIRFWADWFATEGPGPGQVHVGLIQALDQNIAQAKANGLTVILTSRAYPLWANGTQRIKDQPNSPAALAAIPDRRPGGPNSHATLKDLTLRYPGTAVDANGNYSDAYSVGIGSDWYFWIKFLLARYNANRHLLDNPSDQDFGHYAALLRPTPDPRPMYVDENSETPGPGQCPDGYTFQENVPGYVDPNGDGGSACVRNQDQSKPPVIPAAPAGAMIDYFEMVNEPNGSEMWPQQTITTRQGGFGPGNLISHLVVAGMFESAQAAVTSLGGGPVLVGPATEDYLGSRQKNSRFGRSIRTNTSVDFFTEKLLRQLEADKFVPGLRFVWSHHNYSDVTYKYYAKPRRGGVSVGPRTNRAALVRAKLLAHGWAAFPASDPTNPQVFLTEGGVIRPDLKKAGVKRENVDAEQARRLAKGYREMSDQRHLGKGIALFTQFLFYTVARFDSGLCVHAPDMPPTIPPDGALPQYERPAYHTWAKLG